MSGTSNVVPSIMIKILSSQCLLWFGLKKILESSRTLPIFVLPFHGSPDKGLHRETQADVIILDMETNRDAIGTIRQIRESALTSKIVLLCGFEDKDLTREALTYGVEGVILKVQPPAVVLAMIEALYDQGIDSGHAEHDGSVGPRKASKQKPESSPQVSAWGDTVTEREWEVIRLVKEGLSNKEIADRLCIADGTVRHHLTNIFDKLGVANRQKLLLHAHQFSSSHVWHHDKASIRQVRVKLPDADCTD